MLRIGNPPRNSSFEVVEVLFDIAFLSSCELNVLSYTDNFLKALVFLKDILSPSCLAYNEYMDIVYRFDQIYHKRNDILIVGESH